MYQTKILDHVKMSPIGYCIYCFTDKNLTDEHIVPYALSGTYVLPLSSCKKCSKITGALEGKVLRNDSAMHRLRAFKRLLSRRKKEFPQKASIVLIEDGVEKEIEYPIHEGPHFLSFPIFPPPVKAVPLENYQSGIMLNGLATMLFGQGKLEKILKEEGIKNFQFKQTSFPSEFARMIAKIAYSFGYAEGKINFRNQQFLDSLLGKTNDIGRWVGIFPQEYAKHPGVLHRLAMKGNVETGFLQVDVQLFSESGTPTYSVILRTPE